MTVSKIEAFDNYCASNAGLVDSSAAMNRRSFLNRMALAMGALYIPVLSGCGSRDGDLPRTTVAKTLYGRVRGARENGIVVFKGIPYAGSPAGANRFKPAPELKPWSGIRDALAYGPQSIQPPDPAWPKEWKPAVSSEDCLFLNVWTPGINDGKKRPVMFYSHGGGFSTGNGGADVWPQNEFHDGAALAESYDVVVVTHNHRLGIMGYLYLGDLLGEEYAASGTVGMLDIIRALGWVRDNIAEFGGDPDTVMIWGESGGGAKTSALTAMPSAQGLYHKASIESGAALRMRSRESAGETAQAVLKALGLNEKQASKLLTIPAADLCDAMQKLPRKPSSSGSVSRALVEGIGFSPMVDGHHLPAHPYDPIAPAISANIPLLVGINKDETIFMHRGSPEIFSMNEEDLHRRLEPTYRDKTGRILEVYGNSRPDASPAALYIAITTAQWMWLNAITLAERRLALQHAAPIFMYIFSYESQEPVLPGVDFPAGAAHAAEIPFKFNHPGSSLTSDKNPDRVKAARNMSRAWASFARNSDPSHDEIPKWPAYTLERRATMFLNTECRVIDDPYREERLLWKELSNRKTK
jgi:para-nitrobenzyl esterase